MKSIIMCITAFMLYLYASAQAKYPIPIRIEKIRMLSLSNDVKLNDTTKFIHSNNMYFKFVLFDPRGKSYFEIYKDSKLYAKGYYENSLDTLKEYASSVPIDGQPSKIEIFKYFYPLRNGEWVELIKGKYVRRNYSMGVLVKKKVVGNVPD